MNNNCDTYKRNYYITLTCLLVLLGLMTAVIIFGWYFSTLFKEAAENTTEGIVGGFFENFFGNINN